jgi:hypothetical protein
MRCVEIISTPEGVFPDGILLDVDTKKKIECYRQEDSNSTIARFCSRCCAAFSIQTFLGCEGSDKPVDVVQCWGRDIGKIHKCE